MGIEDESIPEMSVSADGTGLRPRKEFDDELDKARENKPDYIQARDEIVNLFNKDPFDQDAALNKIKKWNNTEESGGRIGGHYFRTSTRCKHGEVNEYYYREKQGFKIGFAIKQ